MNITHRMLATVASAAYRGTSKISALGFDEVIRYKKDNTVAYICIHKPSRQVVVAFRGTDDMKDWSLNLDFIKVKSPFNRDVHKGFYSAYDSIRIGLEQYIRQLAGWDIYMTGHSLGAALAVVCVVESGVKFKEVVTFGQPKVYGSNSHINLSKYNLVRYVNRADLVCRVPSIGYQHSGECYFINSRGGVRVNPSTLYMRADSFWKFWDWFSDHGIDNYIKSFT